MYLLVRNDFTLAIVNSQCKEFLWDFYFILFFIYLFIYVFNLVKGISVRSGYLCPSLLSQQLAWGRPLLSISLLHSTCIEVHIGQVSQKSY